MIQKSVITTPAFIEFATKFATGQGDKSNPLPTADRINEFEDKSLTKHTHKVSYYAPGLQTLGHPVRQSTGTDYITDANLDDAAIYSRSYRGIRPHRTGARSDAGRLRARLQQLTTFFGNLNHEAFDLIPEPPCKVWVNS